MYKTRKLIIILFFFSFSFVCFGVDPPPPDPPPCPTNGDPPVGTPIEDGVPVVLGLALFYAAFKLHQARKKLANTEDKV
jgi:hypothetical protein